MATASATAVLVAVGSGATAGRAAASAGAVVVAADSLGGIAPTQAFKSRPALAVAPPRRKARRLIGSLLVVWGIIGFFPS
ncbi:MAG: hypothetical protein HY328_03055 [Chloroflexi bacterium]|nr:hypothetical protein [Chloroflexota bacterium]